MNKKDDAPKRDRVPMSFKGTTTKTKQEFKAGTTVNNILNNYATMGVNDLGLRLHASVMQLPFGEFDSVRDYQTKLNTVIRVNEYFAALPSGIRDMFKNQPGNMVSFMADPKNLEKCQELGLFADPKKADKKEPGTAPPPPPKDPKETPK